MEIPPYFQKYMDEKFDSLHERFDALSHEHDKDILEMKDDLSSTRKDVQWLNQKVWGAIGIASVVVIVGGILAANFRALNRAQLQEAISPLSKDVEKLKSASEYTSQEVNSMKKTFEQYEFVFDNQ